MRTTDPILLTLYILILSYIISQIINAFNDEIEIRLDSSALKAKLADQGVQDLLDISFKFEKRYEFDKLKQLDVSISNKSSHAAIYVDWDCCTFTDLDKRARRVARLMPGTTIDLFQSQVFSTIAPGTTLKEKITAEDILQRKSAAKGAEVPLTPEMEISKPLIDPAVLKKNTKFMKRAIELEFCLELAFRLTEPSRSFNVERVQIPCRFTFRHLPWQAALPWNPR